MSIIKEEHTYIKRLSDKMIDSSLTDFEIIQLVSKIFNQDYKIEMELVEGFQFYTLTNKDITIKSIGYVVDKIIIKGRELSKNIIQAISEEASGKLQWIIMKWHSDNKMEREKQYQERIIEDNNFLRQYIKESEDKMTDDTQKIIKVCDENMSNGRVYIEKENLLLENQTLKEQNASLQYELDKAIHQLKDYEKALKDYADGYNYAYVDNGFAFYSNQYSNEGLAQEVLEKWENK